MSEFLAVCGDLRRARSEADLDAVLDRIEDGADAGLLSEREAGELVRAVGWRLDEALPTPSAAVVLVEMYLARRRADAEGDGW